MAEIYGAQGKTEDLRGDEGSQELRVDPYGGEDARRASQGTGTQRLTPDRENRSAGNRAADSIGGILDQLIEDARKQLAKSRECIVWYQSESKEIEEKLRRFEQLKELHEQQIQDGDSEESEVPP